MLVHMWDRPLSWDETLLIIAPGQATSLAEEADSMFLQEALKHRTGPSMYPVKACL